MLGLTSLELYKSKFSIKEENNKFEIYRDGSNKFGFLELKDELEEILNISHNSKEHLQDEVKGQRIVDKYIEVSHEKETSDGYLILLLDYARSPFRDFESYWRIVVGLDEEDVQLILKHYISHFITFGLTPGDYTIQDISDPVHTFSGHSEILQIEYDDISMKTKTILKYIGGRKKSVLGTLRFDERSFSHTLLGFTPYWDYKPSNSSGVYTSDKT